MPIIDVELVATEESALSKTSIAALADALGKVFGSPPGRTWVRVRFLSSSAYAENESTLSKEELPVFATVLHTRPPEGEALTTEAKAITLAIASCVGRDPERVHVQYAPAGAGRQAFGGKLVQ